jgi:signal transduction histidine kinase
MDAVLDAGRAGTNRRGLDATPLRAAIEINDDAVGIDTSDVGRTEQAARVGLAMVLRRVEDGGSRLEIETRADGATHSRIVLPMREAV